MSNDAKQTITAPVVEVAAANGMASVAEVEAVRVTNEGVPAPTLVQSPFCGSLRSKKFFLLDRLASSAEDYVDAANHIWCCETQEVIGPDNRRVDPNACGPGRACYSSAVKGV
ncbi:MAG TPA: hypothetical protein VGK82_00845 [Pyrinomonadaceae bacterium]